jgi:hypothetical protein
MRFLEDNGVLYEEEGPVMWRCEGCGFRLDLPEDVAPPMWHTLDRPMGTPPDDIPDCPNINWIKLGERERPKPASDRDANAADMSAELEEDIEDDEENPLSGYRQPGIEPWNCDLCGRRIELQGPSKRHPGSKICVGCCLDGHCGEHEREEPVFTISCNVDRAQRMTLRRRS